MGSRRGPERTHPRTPNPATAGELLRLVREGTATTRTELGRATGLSRTAVVSRVGALLDIGLLRQIDEGSAGVGRPPTHLLFDASVGVVLGAAIGRSRTQVA